MKDRNGILLSLGLCVLLNAWLATPQVCSQSEIDVSAINFEPNFQSAQSSLVLDNNESPNANSDDFTSQDISPNTSAPQGYDNGNDPSIVRKRMTLKSEYVRFKNGLAINTTTLQAAFPILQEADLRMNFGFDLPMNYYEVEEPIAAVLAGLGDMKLQLMGTLPSNSQITFLVGSNLWLPTAEQQLLELPDIEDYTNVDLGTGKVRLEPIVGCVYFLNEKLFIVPIYAHDLSIAGKPEAATINRGTARFFVNLNLERGKYFSSETQFLINHVNDNDVDAFQKFELGKAFKNGTVFYMKPGIGIAPDLFNREWSMELGLRFIF